MVLSANPASKLRATCFERYPGVCMFATFWLIRSNASTSAWSERAIPEMVLSMKHSSSRCRGRCSGNGADCANDRRGRDLVDSQHGDVWQRPLDELPHVTTNLCGAQQYRQEIAPHHRLRLTRQVRQQRIQ